MKFKGDVEAYKVGWILPRFRNYADCNSMILQSLIVSNIKAKP
jgi:hypothetical protein